MFNVFTYLLPVIVALHFKTCVCDVWDDADQQRMLIDVIPELYWKYRKALDASDETTFTFRRALHNKEYIIHINRLKAVNGLKKHNLIVKESSDDNPLIYINNPVETKVPNSYLTLEGFKDLLVDRALRQRNELEKQHKTISTTKFNVKKTKMTHNKRKRIQTKPSKYVKEIETTKTLASKVTNSGLAKSILTTPDTIRKKSTPTKALPKTTKDLKRVTVKTKSTSQKSTIGKRINDDLNIKVSSTTEFKTETVNTEKSNTNKPTSENITTDEPFIIASKTIKYTSNKAIKVSNNAMSVTDENINAKSTTAISATEALISQKSIIEKLTDNQTAEKTITKKSTAEELTSDKTNTEKLVDKEPAQTTVNILRNHVKSVDHKSEEVSKNKTIQNPAKANETVDSVETNFFNTPETSNIELNTTAELTKKTVIVEFTTKAINPIEEVTTEFIKKEVATIPLTELTKEDLTKTDHPSTIRSYLRRKTTSRDQEASAERDWTKRLTTRRTTKATTRRSTLGRPLVYMGGSNDGMDRWK